MQHAKFILIVFTTLFCSCLFAQEKVNVDALYSLARSDAFDGNYEEARTKLDKVLALLPGYVEVKVLKARTYSWEKNYSQAKIVLQEVLAAHPENVEALSAIADVELLSGQFDAALEHIVIAISGQPQSPVLMLKKATIEEALGMTKQALISINAILAISPDNEKAIALQQALRIALRKQQVSLTAGVDVFSKNFDPAFYTTFQYLRKEKKFTTVLSINQARRFNINGIQGELDIYPKFGSKAYGYINYGYSSSLLFPEHRVGGEFYSSITKAIDGSLGFRYLSFATSNVFIYTGSIGYTLGNYWVAARPFITTQDVAGAALSLNIEAKRYFNNPENKIGLVVSLGYSPDIRTIQATGGVLTDELFALVSRRVELSGQKLLGNRWVGFARFALTRQEQTFELGDYLWITSAIAGIGYKF